MAANLGYKAGKASVAFAMEDYYIWDSSVILVDGIYHMFASRWPKSLGFGSNWLFNSEIVHATSSTPEGPYIFQNVVGRLSRKCNTTIQNFSWSVPVKTLSWAVVNKALNKLNILKCNRPEIKPLGKEETDNIIGVLVCSTLPGLMRLSKVDKRV